MLALCIQFGLKPQHLDVKTAFLNAKLKHTIYIKLPPGIKIAGKEYGRLLKSLYGLNSYTTKEAWVVGWVWALCL